MTDITELTQRNELLIANGNETANLLRHLANNEIDSDYFAVVSECEAYGQETDAELSITEFALRAAGYVDALVEALEKAQQQITQLESRTVTVKFPDIMPPEAAPAHYWGSGESMAYADGYNKSAADLKTSFALSCSSADVNVEFE
ncbi:TPA: hypothetical protein ACGPHA_003634 [Klebsiella variicola]